jgi:peroxiredoxin
MTNAVPRHPPLLPNGTVAPDFCLHSTPDQKLALSELLGRPVVLVFYPADWSPVCGDQLGLYNEVYAEFEKYKATVVGISVDGPWCHREYGKQRELAFPLLSDFEPKGEVSKLYNAYRPEDGCSARALYVVDAKGVIRWSYLSPVGMNPGADGILEALENLTKK